MRNVRKRYRRVEPHSGCTFGLDILNVRNVADGAARTERHSGCTLGLHVLNVLNVADGTRHKERWCVMWGWTTGFHDANVQNVACTFRTWGCMLGRDVQRAIYVKNTCSDVAGCNAVALKGPRAPAPAANGDSSWGRAPLAARRSWAACRRAVRLRCCCGLLKPFFFDVILHARSQLEETWSLPENLLAGGGAADYIGALYISGDGYNRQHSGERPGVQRQASKEQH